VPIAYRVTRNGRGVGMVLASADGVFAKRFDGLTPREAARVSVWADGFISAAGLFSRTYYDDGAAEWGLELVPYAEWVQAPRRTARPPARVAEVVKCRPADDRHNPDLDAAFAEPPTPPPVPAKELRHNPDLDAAFGV